MKKAFAISLLFLFTVTMLAYAHAGEVHTYMGTITMLHDDGSFMMKKTDGKTIMVLTSKTTKYLHADDHPGSASELKVGSRVVVKMSTDGKTATSIKMSAPSKTRRK
jgi:hypothetical protein